MSDSLTYGEGDVVDDSLLGTQESVQSSGVAQSEQSGGQHGDSVMMSTGGSASGGGGDSPLRYVAPSSPISVASVASSATSGVPRRRKLGRGDLAQGNPIHVVLPGGGEAGGDPQSEIGQAQAVIWGTNVNVDDCIRRFTKFFDSFTEPESDRPKYQQLLNELADAQGLNLNIDCQNLHSADPKLYQQLINYPQEIIPIFDRVINDRFKTHFPEIAYEEDMNIQVKLMNLLERSAMRDVGPEQIDKMISIRAMVIRVSAIAPELKVAFFRCVFCQTEVEVEIDRGRIQEPRKCPNNACGAANALDMIHNRCSFSDKQLVKVQETPDSIPAGETPSTVDVFAYDDLVDVAKPGDRVIVTGVYRAVPIRLNPRKRNVRSVYKTFVDAVHFQKTSKRRLDSENEDQEGSGVVGQTFQESVQNQEAKNANEEEIRELAKDPDIYQKLTDSLAPSIWELEDVKKGVLCQLFGGTHKQFSQSGSGRFRGEINVLLCGDPGTSKSQLLQYVHKIAPRGIYTSGKGSSAVGLTAYITKDPESGEMVLESGALVLSDRGICCIDEFDKMSDSARSILHEVMEQQTISVAKAGIICSLNARTSILAAANPKESRYDPSLSVVENILLPPTLISRFDLIYLILDKPNESLDRRLARHLVGLYYSDEERMENKRDYMSIDKLARYISLARRDCHPLLSEEAAKCLIDAYTTLRSSGKNYNSKVITATPRQLESLIRLSEALAKMKFATYVTKDEVDEALRLMRVATQSAATDPKTGQINIDLITTGTSSLDRQEREAQSNALTDIIDELPGDKNSFNSLLHKFNEQSDRQLSRAQFKDLLEFLESREVVRIGSWSRKNPTITRLAD